MYQPLSDCLILQKLLDEVQGVTHQLMIVETGEGLYGSTAAIADWVGKHAFTTFNSVSINSRAQNQCHKQLEIFQLAQYCTFRTQSPTKFLSDMTWVDFALLHPSDLSDGVQQFALALSAGASTIVIKDYQTAAAHAVRKAEALGWKIEKTSIYSILKRN